MNRSKTILIVDDDPMYRDLLKTVFEQEGYTILQAVDGTSCLNMVAQKKPDVILLDVMMPDTNGMTVLQKLTRNQQLQDIPTIVLSNHTDTKTISETIASGAYNYVIKSHHTPTEILDLVEAQLKKHDRPVLASSVA